MKRVSWLKQYYWLLLFIIPISLGMMGNGVYAGEEPPVLKMTIQPTKQIYSIREGLVMKFIFTAQAKAKLCLDKDIFSQMQVNIAKPGVGKIPLKPLVLKDNSQLFQEPMKVHWLEAGESMTLRANLKRFQFDNGQTWEPGEYSVGAVFNLCEQTPTEKVTEPGQEIPIKSAGQGWFMIMI